MDTQTRQALKQEDPLVHATAASAEWLQTNKQQAIKWGVIALVALLLIVAGAVVYSQRSAAAETAFGNAMNLYLTPIANPAQPAPPGTKTFASLAERARLANPLFLDVANHYGMTPAGHDALYFAGLTFADMGDSKQAETYLQKAVSDSSKNLSSLAKLSLANMYSQGGRTSDAVILLQQLVDKPTDVVPSGTSQLTLAAIYQTTDPAKAHQIYSVLKDKDKTTAAGEIATQKLAGK